ncbi:MAG: hypothetical protein A3205_04540 [Methanomassiliicoccales archaeon Mx-03]|nr:MAG: hypothetical protein A3205_04540 [Methanomassiliicoccales archaeon Mx-03]
MMGLGKSTKLEYSVELLLLTQLVEMAFKVPGWNVIALVETDPLVTATVPAVHSASVTVSVPLLFSILIPVLAPVAKAECSGTVSVAAIVPVWKLMVLTALNPASPVVPPLTVKLPGISTLAGIVSDPPSKRLKLDPTIAGLQYSIVVERVEVWNSTASVVKAVLLALGTVKLLSPTVMVKSATVAPVNVTSLSIVYFAVPVVVPETSLPSVAGTKLPGVTT